MTRARHVVLVRSSPGEPTGPPAKLTDADLVLLQALLEGDRRFREQFDVDPVAAAEAAGMDELAAAIAEELRALVAVAERIASDESFRAALHDDPIGTLAGADLPAETAESFLEATTVSDEVVERLPEVVAHRYQQPSARARAVLFLLESSSVVERIRAAARVG